MGFLWKDKAQSGAETGAAYKELAKHVSVQKFYLVHQAGNATHIVGGFASREDALGYRVERSSTYKHYSIMGGTYILQHAEQFSGATFKII